MPARRVAAGQLVLLLFVSMGLSAKAHRASSLESPAASRKLQSGSSDLLFSEEVYPDDEPIAALAQPVIDVYAFISEFVSKFPDGTDVSDGTFDAALGAEIRQQLRKVGIQQLSNQGGVFVVRLAREQEYKLRVRIAVKRLLRFTLARDGNALVFSDIEGMELKVSFFLDWLELKHLKVSKDASGNTVIYAELVSGIVGRVSKTVTLGPDGKPIPPPKK